MEFFEVIKNRHSIRKFKQKKIEEEKLKKIMETMNSAPSGGNLQAYECFLIKNKETIKNLAKASDQPFVGKASVVIVICANEERSERVYGKRGNMYAMNDASIAAAYIELSASALGLGSVWVGDFDDNKVKEILNVHKNSMTTEGRPSVRPVAIIPIGYPDEKPIKTKRRDLDDIVKNVN